MWAYVAMLLLSSSMSLSTGSIRTHSGLTHISCLSLSFFTAVRLCRRIKGKSLISLIWRRRSQRMSQNWAAQRLTKCCDHPPVPVISSRCQRSVFRDAVFLLSVFRLQLGRARPLPNGDVYIYDISTQRRGHSLLCDAGNDLFFSPYVFPQTNCGGIQLLTWQSDVWWE